MRAPHDPIYEGFHPGGAHALEPMGLAEAMKRLELYAAQGARLHLRQPLVVTV